MARGTIKRFSIEKGYGWISPLDTSGPDLFFHISGSLSDEHQLEPGVLVDYDDVPGRDGKRMAVDVIIRPQVSPATVRAVLEGDIVFDQ